MNFQLATERFLKDLDDIRQENNHIIDRAYSSIQLCRSILYKYKKYVIQEGFKSLKDEITFFKIIKQVPLVKLIYFSEVHSFEIQFPKGSRNLQSKFIRKKINKLNRFFLYNLDFGRYIKSGFTHFDEEYYTRNHLDNYYITTSKFYFQDPDFSTPRDMLLGKYEAYNSLILYLDKRMTHIKKSKSESPLDEHTKIPWPFTNTDFTELVYALWFAGLKNQKDLSIIQLALHLDQIFEHQSTDIYKNFQEIKRRKHSSTSFLDHMATSLLSAINKSHE